MGSLGTIICGVWSYHTKMHAYLAVLLQWTLDAIQNLVRGWFRFNNNYGLQQNNVRVLATLGKEKMVPWAYLFIENGLIYCMCGQSMINVKCGDTLYRVAIAKETAKTIEFRDTFVASSVGTTTRMTRSRVKRVENSSTTDLEERNIQFKKQRAIKRSDKRKKRRIKNSKMVMPYNFILLLLLLPL